MKPCTALKKIKYIQQGGTFYTAYKYTHALYIESL